MGFSSWFTLCACLLIFHMPCILSAALPFSGTSITSDGATYVGATDTTYNIISWLGVRFAEPPTSSLRLQPPVAASNKGTVTTQSFGPQCYQIDPVYPSAATVSEDCLFLNIYKPSVTEFGPLPVLFWIHGGSFNDGSGENYDARSLVNQSVELESPTIVVTINYRLNFFGFSAGAEVAANNGLNLGLLDQRLALEWVQANIKAFGGDDARVTIFGESSGATSVGLQMLAYNGKYNALFRAAILESGAPQDTLPTAQPTYAPYQTIWNDVVTGVGCNGTADVFRCIQGVPIQKLSSVINTIGHDAEPLPAGPPKGAAVVDGFPLPPSSYPWQPVIDGKFLTGLPTKLIAEGNYAKVPTILGFTTDELTHTIPTYLNISSDSAVVQLASFILPYIPLTFFEEVLALEPLSLYPNTYNVGGTQWKRATEIASDLFGRCAGRSFIQNLTEYVPTYKYRWNAALPAQIQEAPYFGIVHAADIPYVFGRSISPYLTAPLDVELSRAVQQAFLSFAASLSPNSLGDLAPGVKWPEYEKGTEMVLVFQKSDGTGEYPNGNSGVPVGQGLHVETDPDDRPACDYIISQDATLQH